MEVNKINPNIVIRFTILKELIMDKNDIINITKMVINNGLISFKAFLKNIF